MSEISTLSKENEALQSHLATAKRASEKNQAALNRLSKKHETVISESKSQLIKSEIPLIPI